jgi:hypothetical protein
MASYQTEIAMGDPTPKRIPSDEDLVEDAGKVGSATTERISFPEKKSTLV